MRGDFTPGKTVYVSFNTHQADGTPITLAGTPACSVYKRGSTTESTAGVTLSADYDSRTGYHIVAIDTSADGTFYSAGSDFDVVVTTGTVDGISVVGTVVGSFSLSNRSALRPTTADRTLDVSAAGEAGIDWANIGSPTTTVGLSGTTVKTATDVETDTADIQSRLPAALGANGNIKADVRDFDGTAGTFDSGIPDVSLYQDYYHADIHFTRDQANTQDEYTATWFKNGVRVAASITSPTIQVVKRADGTDLIASTAMTEVGSTETYKYDATGAERQTVGEAVLVIVAATIDGGSRSFSRLIGRDSS